MMAVWLSVDEIAPGIEVYAVGLDDGVGYGHGVDAESFVQFEESDGRSEHSACAVLDFVD